MSLLLNPSRPAYTLAVDLPSPSGLDWWLFERPEGLALGLAVLGIVGLIAFQRRGQAGRGAVILLIGIAAGVTVFATGWLVETPRERVAALTQTLIRSSVAGDRAAVDPLLARELVVAGGGQIVPTRFGREELLSSIEGFAWFKIDEWYQRADGAVIDGPNAARTRAVVRVRSSYYETLLVPMTWEFTWQRAAPDPSSDSKRDRWLLSRLELVTMWGKEPSTRWAEMALRAGHSARSGGAEEDAAPSALTRDGR